MLFHLTGHGIVELPGYGMADAEHRLEKELAQAAPGATLRILATRRLDEVSRIVESFEMTCRVEMTIEADGPEEEGRREALRMARTRLGGTRFDRIGWEKVIVARPAGEGC